MKLSKTNYGYEVVSDGNIIADVVEDVFGGWRPYSIIGYCYTTGQPTHKTPQAAMNWISHASD